MNEHRRINERLIEYWKTLKGDRPYPSEQDIDPDAIADIWDDCFLIQIKHNDDIHGFHYSYLGPSLIEAYGDNLTGQDVYETLISTYTDTIVQSIQRVLETRAPIHIDSEFVNTRNITIKYRSCLLPLGPDNAMIDFVIGGMRWRGF